MQVYFIENENPGRNSSSGHMSYIINLSEYFNKVGINSTLVGSGKELSNIIELPGVTSFKDFISISSKEISNSGYFFKLFFSRGKLNKGEPPIFHFHHPYMIWPLITFKRSNILVLTIHGRQNLLVKYKKGKFYNWLYNFLNNRALKHYDCIIFVDKRSRDYYKSISSLLVDKIKLIPTGVNLEKFIPLNKGEMREKHGFEKNENLVIFVGRLEYQKNLELLIRSCKILNSSIENLTLIIVGEGKEMKSLARLASDINFKNIRFLGELDNNIIPELLNCADVCALTSHWEGSPTVVKEALACNLPVVSVDVGDVKDVIDDIGGCFITEKDPESFADSLFKVLSNKKEIDTRSKVLRYNHENLGKEVVGIYKELIRSKIGVNLDEQ